MANEAAKPKLESSTIDWLNIREVLGDVLELPPEQRPAYLNVRCGGDQLLRERLEELIAAHDDPSAAILDKPIIPLNFPAVTRAEAVDSLLGKRIGLYRLEALIFNGGMGSVYCAVRADDEYKKRVAMKVIRGTFTSRHATEMFRRERQVLASLEHPNIERLLDGGTDQAGSPYLVMEYVEGQRVTEYCTSRRLSIEERLGLFQKICSAVHYAHQNLIIHRDIKPANILVTREGEPKLLDFGIAKVIMQGNPEETLTAWSALTPVYASPEQISGAPISTGTDVYSLGLLLYELLTGKQPLSEFHTSPFGLQKAILEHDPILPSEAVAGDYEIASQAKLEPRLRGDLDSIVCKAIRKRATERYSSVEQFSQDIARHLSNLPVWARPESVRYRAVQYARRHRYGLLAAALVVFSLLIGLGVALYEAHLARVEAARAELRFNDVRKLANSLLFEIHDAIQDLPGSTPARKLIAQRSLEYLDSLSREGNNDPRFLRELATAYERVGELQGQYLEDNLGETSNSLASYGKALRIRRRLGEAKNSDWQDRLSLAASYRRMGSQLEAMNERRKARSDLEVAAELSESILKVYPEDLRVVNELAFDYQILATMQEDLSNAQQIDNRVVALARKMLELQPGNVDAQRRLGSAVLQIAGTQSDRDDFAHASTNFNEALCIFRSIAQLSPTIRDRRHIAVVLNQTGMLHERQGKWKLMLQDDQQAFAVYRQLTQQDPKNALLTQGLAITLANTGEAKGKLHRLEEGRADIRQAIAVMSTLMTDPNAHQRDVLAQMHMLLADNFGRSGEPAFAISEYLTAEQIYERMPLNRNPTAIVTCKLGISQAEHQMGKDDAAVKDFNQVIALTLPAIEPGYRADANRAEINAAALAYAGLGDIEAQRAAQFRSSQAHWKHAIDYYRKSLTVGHQLPPLAQLDVTDFHTTSVAKRLRMAEHALSKSPEPTRYTP